MSNQGKGRGRPTVDNKAILREILSSETKRQELFDSLDMVIKSKEALKVKQDMHKDKVKSVGEATGLAAGFINSLVASIIKGDGEEKVEEHEMFKDLLEQYNCRENDGGFGDSEEA